MGMVVSHAFGYWFVACRNTMTDEFVETMTIADARKRLEAL